MPHLRLRPAAADQHVAATGRLVLLAAVLGLAASGAAWVLVHLIALITNLALLQTWSWELPPSTAFDPSPVIVVAAVTGGLLVSLIARWAPIIRGHGIPEAMEAILTKQSRIAPKTAVAKPASAAIAIGTGAPFGAEGPIIVTGGALGSLVGQLLPVTPAERKVLLCCGAAAGMAATFGAPLAAVVLALELLLFELSLRSLIPLIVATSIAGGMHDVFFGSGPLFDVPAHESYGIGVLPTFLLLGLACGLLAAIICKGLFLIEAGYRRLPVSDFWHPVIGAAAFAVVGLAVPRALGVGYDQISDVLNERLAVGTVAALFVGKLLAWWLALGSGTSGGTLAPLLLVGACFGTLFGHVAGSLGPGQEASAGAFALVAMAAVFGAATRTPLTSIVFIFELTQDYQSVLPLMGTTVVAVLVAQALVRESLMTEKLARRGLLVSTFSELDPHRTTRVRDVMAADVRTVPVDASVAEATDALLASGHSACPLVDGDQRCLGVVSRSDLLLTDQAPERPVLDLASTDVVAVAPDATLRTALELLLAEHVEHLPVVADDRLVGICTRTDLLRSRQALLDQEQAEDGWLREWRRRRTPTADVG
jgi:H+/Cl- antiporter ClcA/predicted transcriptional regulator